MSIIIYKFSLWEDFSVIGKLKFCKEENKDQLTPLQY